MRKITIDRALIDQALEVLTDNREDIARCESVPYMAQYYDKAISELRKALAQPQQEPVAIHQWRKPDCCNWYDGHPDDSDGGGPYETRVLYTSPPARKPLSDEQWLSIGRQARDMYFGGITNMTDLKTFGKIVEAAHGIKDTP